MKGKIIKKDCEAMSLAEIYDKYTTAGPEGLNLLALKKRLPEFLSPVKEKLDKLQEDLNDILEFASCVERISDTELLAFVYRAQELRHKLGVLANE
jgi:hypothetical protein